MYKRPRQVPRKPPADVVGPLAASSDGAAAGVPGSAPVQVAVAQASAPAPAPPAAGAGGGGGTTNSLLLGEEKEVRRIGDYQLMSAIGRGGFGVVYRGLCISSVETVAIKRVNLQGIPKEELDGIEMEIRLLQGLSHPNIVQYRGALRSDTHLHIVLEFVENGSLSSYMANFGGHFPEPMVAHYIAQVVHGLCYLHSQGVIHRDIKGANILSTKEGIVKLADFGVATRLTESRKSSSVVGTPYWMAPEIIEMTGQLSPACDIWSVGCTVIELLTGKPPYFDLQQMPALFRIVQDEHPPLPEGISTACTSFLLECFQKDPDRRIDANGLRKHPWIKEVVREHEARLALLSVGQAAVSAATAGPTSSSSSASSASAAAAGGGGKPAAGKAPAKPSAVDVDADADESDWDKEIDDELDSGSAAASRAAAPMGTVTALGQKAGGGAAGKVGAAGGAAAGAAAAAALAGGAILSPHAGELFQKTSSKGSKAAGTAAASSTTAAAGKAGGAVSGASMLDEDDVFAGMSDDEGDEANPARTPSKRIPAGAGAGAGAGGSSGQQRPSAPASGAAASAATSGAAGAAGAAKTLAQFKEENDDDELDFDEELGKLEPAELRERPQRAWDAPADLGGELAEDDPFDQIEFVDTDNTSSLLARFDRLTRLLTQAADETTVLDTCQKLSVIIRENAAELRASVTSRGVIPLMEMLESSSPAVLQAVLSLVNQIVVDNTKFQQNMSIVGLIPAIIRFSEPTFPSSVRREAASFIRHFCYTSDYTRKMFVACGGIPALVGFLRETDYEGHRALIWNAVDCIRHVFDITTSPRNDFCRLFCKYGLLPPLVSTLLAVHSDALTQQAEAAAAAAASGVAAAAGPSTLASTASGSQTLNLGQSRGAGGPAGAAGQLGSGAAASPAEYVVKIAQMLEWFANGDQNVKTHFAQRAVLDVLIRLLPTLPQEAIILVLRSLRSISMDPAALDLLEAAGAIPAIIPFLGSAHSENQAQALLNLYYLSLLKQTRQEELARCGIIPHLRRFISTKHPLVQFAYPIVFSMGNASKTTRAELKKHGGVQLFVDILADPYWHTNALNCLGLWLAEEPERVGFLLTTPSNCAKLATVFRTALRRDTALESYLILFCKLLSVSPRLNTTLGRQLLPLLLARIKTYTGDIKIRVNQLQLLRVIMQGQTDRGMLALVQEPGVMQKLREEKEKTNYPMVSGFATNVLESIAQIAEAVRKQELKAAAAAPAGATGKPGATVPAAIAAK